ncbi:MAG: hypothetical protein ACR2PR_08215 [Pseudohongiellaceae bacterium]
MLRLLLVLPTLLVTALAWAHHIDPAQRVLERPLVPNGYLTDKYASLLVEGDFDGNGVQDQAFYVAYENKRYALVVFMNNGAQTFELTQTRTLLDEGVELVTPGVYEAWCAHDGCQEKGDGPSELRLEHDAIMAISYERAAVIYHWEDGHFHRLQYAD